jgi:hypothetical protein
MGMNCYKALGIIPPVSMDELKAAYRKSAALHHPDRGGNHQTMVGINEAYEQAKWELERGRMRKNYRYSQPEPRSESRPKEHLHPKDLSQWIENIDLYIQIQEENDYKKAWLMFQLLDSEIKPPIEAWEYLANKLGYKKGWAWYKYSEWE